MKYEIIERNKKKHYEGYESVETFYYVRKKLFGFIPVYHTDRVSNSSFFYRNDAPIIFSGAALHILGLFFSIMLICGCVPIPPMLVVLNYVFIGAYWIGLNRLMVRKFSNLEDARYYIKEKMIKEEIKRKNKLEKETKRVMERYNYTNTSIQIEKTDD